MKHPKTASKMKTALGLAVLAGCVATPARADSTQYLSLVLSANGTTKSASFSDVVGAIGNFTDDYIFSSPPELSALTFTGAAGSGISFTSIKLLTYGTTTASPLSGTSNPTTFSLLTVPSLTSAVYVLEIKGLSTSLTASYTGGITNAAAVPEPASWALWLLGLVGTASLARRRGTLPIGAGA